MPSLISSTEAEEVKEILYNLISCGHNTTVWTPMDAEAKGIFWSSVSSRLPEMTWEMLTIPDLSEEQVLGYFMKGVSEVICQRIRTHDPQNVIRAMDIARDVKEELHGEAMAKLAGSVNAEGRWESQEAFAASLRGQPQFWLAGFLRSPFSSPWVWKPSDRLDLLAQGRVIGSNSRKTAAEV